MRLDFLLGLTLFALIAFSCSKRQESDTTGTDAAKLRPEVAAAQGGASPSPTQTPSTTPVPEM
ncbi:MAG: hypothetical protein M3119_00140 [Verrucomicrobiota bacterium]|nr:hypothetical protein [Verrucomicrobiota bacterium]MDQ6938548.1 hypothetical protein [Verrucomicrobiota bacterium]